MLSVLPQIESPAWNLGLLVANLSDVAPATELLSGYAAGRAGLRNVFIELSGLDAVGWEQAEREGAQIEVARAIWIFRDEDRMFTTLFINQYPHGGQIIGPFEIRYERASRTFEMRGTGKKASWIPLLNEEFLARLSLKGLALIRYLSPCWKLGAFARTVIQQDDRFVSYAQIEWALADIMSLRELSGPIRNYYALHTWGREEPFAGGVLPSSPALDGALKLEGEPFARLDPEYLITAAEPQLAALGGNTPKRPPRD
jgi:hypothetical protein